MLSSSIQINALELEVRNTQHEEILDNLEVRQNLGAETTGLSKGMRAYL